jgi:DNA-binding CsgD family transcriptional regulator/tetratricopeptide (TPR) repeat protein
VAKVATSRTGSAVLLAGAGGIGKTRLAQTAIDDARERGWSVAVGTAYAPEQGLPYSVVGDAFCPLFRQVGSSTLDVLSRGERIELAHICPALFPDEPLPPVQNHVDGAELRARVLRVFERVIERLVNRRPLLVVLENLHWADSSSLELAHLLARRAARSPLVFLGTYDEAERDRNASLVELERSLTSQPHVAIERLLPLGPDHVQSLVDRAFGVNPDRTGAFVAQLTEYTRGNPFFITETLRSLIDSGHLRFAHGGWLGWDAKATVTPQTLRDAIVARLERLSPDARTLASCAAVHAGRIEHDAVPHISGLSSDAAARSIDELLVNKMLSPVAAPGGEGWSDSNPTYELTPPLLRMVLYEAIGPARARLLHGQIAEGLERYFGARASQHAEELAYHFSRSDREGGGDRVLRYLALAGQRAVARRAYHEGKQYLAAALEEADGVGAGAAFGVNDRLDLLFDYGLAAQRDGDIGRALGAYERACEEAVAIGNASSVARAEYLAAMACFHMGRPRAAIEHSQSGLATGGGIQHAVMLRYFKAMAHSFLGEEAEARREMEVVVTTAEAVGDARLHVFASELVQTLEFWTGHLTAARTACERMISFAREARFPERELVGEYWLTGIEYFAGNGPGTDAHIAACRELAARVASPTLDVLAAEASGMRAFLEGDWPTAREMFERAVDTARTSRFHSSLPRLLSSQARLDLGVGDLDRAGSALEEANRISGATRGGEGDTHGMIPVLAAMAEHAAAQGRLDAARRHADAAMALIERTGHVTWSAVVVPILARILIDSGQLDCARDAVTRLRNDGRRYGLGLASLHGDVLKAELDVLEAPDREAVEALRVAIDAMREAGLGYDAARRTPALAQALVAMGSRADAVRLLRETHAFCARIGAEPMVRLIRERLRALNVRPPGVSGTASREEELTSRERELVRLVSERRSNKEIARLLDISQRTVTTHLNHIFGKLGIHSRGELIARR